MTYVGDGTAPAGAEPLRLRAPRHRASARAVRYWTVRAAAGWVAALIVGTVVVTQALDGTVALMAGAVAVVVALAHLIVMPRWRFRVHRWEATDTAVYTQSGWLDQERRIAPIVRIQTVDTQRGPFEQLFGLANVTVTTASAAGPLKIHALDRAVADDLVAMLTERTGTEDGT